MKWAFQTKLAFMVGILVALCAQRAVAKIGGRKQEATERRKLQNRLQVAGNSGTPPADMLPLGECWGDCDNDAECDVGLVCFQRDALDEVPGCNGGGNDDSVTDYCIIDPSVPEPGEPTAKPSPNPTRRPTPRPSPGPTDSPTISPAPTNTPTKKPSSAPSSEPTKSPSSSPTKTPTYTPFGRLEYVGNEGTFYSAYPMGPPMVNLYTDQDCADGLYCHQRNSFGAVPYCSGGENEPSTADFCAWDGTGDAPEIPGPPPEGFFRLKLYWEEGYKWQNETFEREWCMMYNYQGYPGTGLCWYGEKNEWCDQSQIYVAKCVEDPRMWFTFVNVTSSNLAAVDEYLIMTGDEERCFERKGREIYLQECDPQNSLQRWFALNGDFFGDKFELSQLGYNSQCITNDHHPKSGEVVETHFCEDSRGNESQTSYWERY